MSRVRAASPALRRAVPPQSLGESQMEREKRPAFGSRGAQAPAALQTSPREHRALDVQGRGAPQPAAGQSNPAIRAITPAAPTLRAPFARAEPERRGRSASSPLLFNCGALPRRLRCARPLLGQSPSAGGAPLRRRFSSIAEHSRGAYAARALCSGRARAPGALRFVAASLQLRSTPAAPTLRAPFARAEPERRGRSASSPLLFNCRNATSRGPYTTAGPGALHQRRRVLSFRILVAPAMVLPGGLR